MERPVRQGSIETLSVCLLVLAESRCPVSPGKFSQMKKGNILPALLGLLLLVCLKSSPAKAQDTKPSAAPSPSSEQKAEQIINRAIEVVGGSNYLNVRTVIGRGYFTAFKDGISQLPA